MKYIKVVIETMLPVPDHTEILSHPQDEVECVKIGTQYYMPALRWFNRYPNGTWVGADDACNDLAGAEGAEEASVRFILEEEFRRAPGESEGESGSQEGRRSGCEAP